MSRPQGFHEFPERPHPFVAPDLSPGGLRLRPESLGHNVYALMANQPPKDNNGVVIGSRAALVVDAGVTPTVGGYIQQEVRELTDRPIRYLVNTTYHGDHTFGNSAFGPEVAIVSSRPNRACMDDLDREKLARSESMFGDPALDTVRTWRKPDVVFDRFLEVDLGGKVVELWHFGPGNGAGDVLVYVRDDGVVWSGNFLVPAGMVPMLLIGDPWSYARSLRSAMRALDFELIVPGHGPIAPAREACAWMLHYLQLLGERVDDGFRRGQDPDDVMADFPVPDGVLDGGDEMVRALNESFHRLNILTTHRRLERSS
ncbi:MBL fold metallo-hydrolase [Pseudonocardia sp. MH-G8]|uniref:MBL fold metallo-hydrolase n=1 Tax=Pseudonocardia sp. MH-G8 TaxID=1854588 RepID=UPI0018EA0D5B|nr:MBL fold metallo-hydrolase [Pseudonocardia sp. MH-G8]